MFRLIAGDIMERSAEKSQELREAHNAGQVEAVHREMGELLFSVFNLCRHLNMCPESALHGATRRYTALHGATGRFESRFRHVEAGLKAEGLDVIGKTLKDLRLRGQRTRWNTEI